MIKLPDTIYVSTAPTNMHLSFDRLAGLVRDQLGGDPRGEALFVFHNTDIFYLPPLLVLVLSVIINI